MVWSVEKLHTQDFICYQQRRGVGTENLSRASSIPASKLFTIVEDCVVAGKSRFVLRNGMASLDVTEPSIDLAKLYKDYHLQEELLGVANYDPNSHTIQLNSLTPQMQVYGMWMSVLNSASENWMHFLTECAPKLDLAVRNSSYLSFGILFDENLPLSALEVLNLLSEGRPMIGIPNGLPLRVSQLLVPTQSVSTCTAFWPRDGFFGTGVFGFDADALKSVRAKILHGFSITPKCTRNVYLNRKSSFRHIVNQTEVAKILSDKKFETFAPGEFSLKEQVKVFSEASVVVAQAGAALANIMFMPKGAKVICLSADSKWINDDYFRQYAEVFDLEFIYVKGAVHNPDSYDESELLSVRHPMNAEFECPISELLNVLERSK